MQSLDFSNTGAVAKIDSFLTALEETVQEPRSMQLRCVQNCYFSESAKGSSRGRLITLDQLPAEAERIVQLAKDLLRYQVCGQRQVLAIQSEIEANIRQLTALGRLRPKTLRGKRATRQSPTPNDPYWNANKRVLFRETYQAAREVQPKLKRLRRQAASSPKGRVKALCKHTGTKVKVPESGEPFIVQDTVGGGAFKKVSRVQSIFSGQFGAQAKSYRSDLKGERDFVSLFRGQEGVIQLLDVSQRDSRRYYMRYHGRTLRSIHYSKIPARKILEAALMLARGLHAIHQKGYYHNDLHSENILVDWNAQTQSIKAVIADLGIMRELSRYSYNAAAENMHSLRQHLQGWWHGSGAKGANPFSSEKIPSPFSGEAFEAYILQLLKEREGAAIAP